MSGIEKELKALVVNLKNREELARQNSEVWPVESRVAGFFSGVAGGIASAIAELEQILGDYHE